MTKVDDTKNPQLFNAPEYPASGQPVAEQSVREVPPPPYSPPEQKKKPLPPNTVPLDRLGEDSESILCPECGYVGPSKVSHKVGGCTVLSIAGLFFLGCTVFGCCLLPLCINGLKDAEHHCPRCRSELATYSRLERRAMIGRPR
ncbi:hypothetical protein NQZ79_g4211 [Umbelopsis isabellina]|nr:hypothetical protein NQZ79_g4211 [Umbelopsis isabellina]